LETIRRYLGISAKFGEHQPEVRNFGPIWQTSAGNQKHQPKPNNALFPSTKRNKIGWYANE
jgi:hypothetical protein